MSKTFEFLGYIAIVIFLLMATKPGKEKIEAAVLQHDFGTNNAMLQGLVMKSGIIANSIVVEDNIILKRVYDLDGKLIAVAGLCTVKFID